MGENGVAARCALMCAAALATAVAGCFSPSLPEVACGPNGECPSGLDCFSGVCLKGPVATPGGDSKITAGSDFTCAVRAGQVYCFGANNRGQLGVGDITTHAGPVPVTGLTEVVAIESGDQHTCALTDTGLVHCWGFGGQGRVGNGGTEVVMSPFLVRLGDRDLDRAATGVVVGGDHSCANTTSGASFCWGKNLFGQIGDATMVDALTPTQVTHAVELRVAGDNHSCGESAAGELLCWGRNVVGQLGVGGMVDLLVPGAAALTSYSAVDAFADHNCAITADGVVCWGLNANGQCGVANSIPLTEASKVPGLTSAEAVTTGTSHSCAVMGGEVYCWGANTSGQLGDGTQTSRPNPEVVPGLSGVVDVHAGNQHTCAELANETYYCWGKNDLGAVGIADIQPQLLPVEVPFP